MGAVTKPEEDDDPNDMSDIRAMPAEEYREIEKKLLWKMDTQIVLLAGLLYTLSFLDRTNISQARLLGLNAQLGLSSYDYSIALTILYVPYISFEIPSNLVIKRIGPARLIPFLVTSWGIVSTLQGIVTTRNGLWINRFFLGLTEAGILPGITIYLTFFYKPSELQLRQAIYFSGASLAGAFGALLSAAISPLHAAGLQPWSWLFIIEGIFTVVVGLSCFYLLPNGPDKVKGLTPTQAKIALYRVTQGIDQTYEDEASAARADKELDKQGLPAAAERPDDQVVPHSSSGSEEAVSKSESDAGRHGVANTGNPELEKALHSFRGGEVLRTLRDPFVGFLAVTHFCNATSVYSLALFAPTVVRELNLGSGTLTLAESLLLVTPPFAFAFVLSIALGLISDRFRWRGGAYLFTFFLPILGFAIAYGTTVSGSGSGGHAGAQYAALMLIAGGAFAGPSVSLSWISIGTAGHYKRATSAALMIVFTNSGGILSTWLWNGSFEKGYLVNLILGIVGFCFTILLEIYVLWHRRHCRAIRESGKEPRKVAETRTKYPGASERQIRQWLGDEHPDFRLEL